MPERRLLRALRVLPEGYLWGPDRNGGGESGNACPSITIIQSLRKCLPKPPSALRRSADTHDLNDPSLACPPQKHSILARTSETP